MSAPKFRLKRFLYGLAEQVLNSKLVLKQEIEDILSEEITDMSMRLQSF